MNSLVQKKEALGLVVVMAAATMLLLVGWRLFWFMTDDAYIAFRYVSNSLLGHGYVWNPPPFQPVEGYTSFLWVVLLDGIWRLLGVEPPDSSNWLALLFSLGTLALTALMMWRLAWNERLRPWRLVWLALGLLGLLTNRTFLTWGSSGLETAMFNFWIALWMWCVCFVTPGPRQLTAVSTVAAGIYLIRPDGLLYVAATLALLVLAWPGQRGRALLARLAAGAPLLMVVIHMLWRHSFYGEWLPNTFYAKSNGWWWECGWRYAASFFLEYGLVVWLLAALAALVVWARRSGFPRLGKTEGGLFQGLEKLLTASAPSLMRGVAVATVLAHVLYYTLIIGGDHFEYRVYSHVVPLLWVSLLWAVNVLMVRRWTAVLALLLALGISWPLPWVHWAKTCELDRRESTRETTEIRHGFRFKTRHYVKLFDDCQTWLIAHFACLRHQGHKMFLLEQLADHPTRAEGSRISGAGFPIMATKTVGYTGWVLPHVCILDQHGLNDYVIARAPLEPQRFRIMAHEHLPPPGYEASFGVNVVLSNRTFVVKPRAAPLTAEDIRRIEAHWFRWLQAPMNTPPPAARPLAAG